MASNSYSTKIKQITVYKFDALQMGLIAANKKNAINIVDQVLEVIVYESIFAPIMKFQLTVTDYIGLLNNFPLTGEEIIVVEYETSNKPGLVQRWIMNIDSITDPIPDDKNRALAYIINCSSIEALANYTHTIQQHYHGTPVDIARRIVEEHIDPKIKKIFPLYSPHNILLEDNQLEEQDYIIPNMHPIAAIDMMNQLAFSQNEEKYSYVFFQNRLGFNIRSIQGMISPNNVNARRKAYRERYKFIPDEVQRRESELNNETRLIANLAFNKRGSSQQRITMGYFNNRLFEINLAQKAYYSTKTELSDVKNLMIDPHSFNTEAYRAYADDLIESDDVSNRTKYVVTNRGEYDQNFSVSKRSNKWGKDLISMTALSQVDVSVVVPGDSELTVGKLFNIEIPEIHGFENIKEDDLISGFYLITELKHIIRTDGYHSTTMKINKDSLKTSIDRESRYV